MSDATTTTKAAPAVRHSATRAAQHVWLNRRGPAIVAATEAFTVCGSADGEITYNPVTVAPITCKACAEIAFNHERFNVGAP